MNATLLGNTPHALTRRPALSSNPCSFDSRRTSPEVNSRGTLCAECRAAKPTSPPSPSSSSRDNPWYRAVENPRAERPHGSRQMHRSSRAHVFVVFALPLASAVLAASSAHAETRLCCFNNWRYSGTCVVQVSGNQVCGDVLGVLNNPMSATTTYCGGTQLRGGWAAVECGTGGTSGASGGTLSQPDYVAPTQPSYTAPSTM